MHGVDFTRSVRTAFHSRSPEHVQPKCDRFGVRTCSKKTRSAIAAGFVAVGALGTAGLAPGAIAGEKLNLPPEVTAALRAACEADVRRLCIRDDPTVARVKQCVMDNFTRLGSRCQMQIVLAGLAP